MLPIPNVTIQKCTRQNVTIRKCTRQNVTIRKCTIRNVTDPLKYECKMVTVQYTCKMHVINIVITTISWKPDPTCIYSNNPY